MSDRPHRAHVVQLNIQGDTWEDIIGELKSVLYSLQADGPTPVRLCGGGGGSWIMEYEHSPGVTPESYMRDVNAWLELRKREEKVDLVFDVLTEECTCHNALMLKFARDFQENGLCPNLSIDDPRNRHLAESQG